MRTTGVDHRLAVLVVDDEADVTNTLAELLTEEGFVVQTALHGRQALASALARRPDLVLLDNVMPDMDGVTLARAMRADPALAAVPVVIMTALPELLPPHVGLYDAVLEKPFSPEQLLGVMIRILLERLA